MNREYVEISTGNIVTSLDIIRARYPSSVGLGGWDDERLNEWGFAVIEPSTAPAIFPGQTLVITAPLLINGVWVQQWRVDEPAPESLAALKTDRHRKINAQRDEMLSSELLFLTTGDELRWQFNASSLQVLNEALLMTGVDEELFLPPYWRDADNVNHVCTRSLLISIAAAYAAYKSEIFTASWMMKAVVDNESTATAEAIAAVHWSDFLTPKTLAVALLCVD